MDNFSKIICSALVFVIAALMCLGVITITVAYAVSLF